MCFQKYLIFDHLPNFIPKIPLDLIILLVLFKLEIFKGFLYKIIMNNFRILELSND